MRVTDNIRAPRSTRGGKCRHGKVMDNLMIGKSIARGMGKHDIRFVFANEGDYAHFHGCVVAGQAIWVSEKYNFISAYHFSRVLSFSFALQH